MSDMDIYVGPNTLEHFSKKYLGDPDNIKGLGDGTVTGAIKDLNDSLSTWEPISRQDIIGDTYNGTLYEFSCFRNQKLRRVKIYLRGSFNVYTTGYKSDVCVITNEYRPDMRYLLYAAVYGQNAILFANTDSDGQISLGTLNSNFEGSQHIVISGEYSY